jgi:hypothetical protein
MAFIAAGGKCPGAFLRSGWRPIVVVLVLESKQRIEDEEENENEEDRTPGESPGSFQGPP